MQFTRIMKVIMTYEFWICGPSLALNLCKKYQIIYANVHYSYSCTYMEHIPVQEWICPKSLHISHVEGNFLRPNELTICPDNGLQPPFTAMLSTHL